MRFLTAEVRKRAYDGKYAVWALKPTVSLPDDISTPWICVSVYREEEKAVARVQSIVNRAREFGQRRAA